MRYVSHGMSGVSCTSMELYAQCRECCKWKGRMRDLGVVWGVGGFALQEDSVTENSI
jgi:hypothetical protein